MPVLRSFGPWFRGDDLSRFSTARRLKSGFELADARLGFGPGTGLGFGSKMLGLRAGFGLGTTTLGQGTSTRLSSASARASFRSLTIAA